MNQNATFRSMFLPLAIFSFTLFYIGCGGSEETMSEDEMVTDTGEYGYAQEEQPATEDSTVPMEEMQQPAEQQQAVEEPAMTAPAANGPSIDQLQSDLDSLKTENLQLQDKLSATEHNNQELMAKISDLEAANMAMKTKMEEKKSAPSSARTSAAPQPGKSSPEEISAYQGAVSLFRSKNYTQAAEELQTLLSSGVKDDYADNCHYWLGLSHFQMKDYTTALAEFQQAMSYRFSEKRDDAQMMIARTYERMGDRARAMEEYKKVVDLYPTSEFVGRAKAKLR